LKSEPNGSRSIELPKCSSGLAQNSAQVIQQVEV